MKSLLFVVPLFGALVLGQGTPTSASACQCPQVKCPGNDPIALCNCLNFRERLCEERCPDYLPTYLPCPVSSPAQAQCTCTNTICPMVWPQSCYCMNNAKQQCYDKCGGTAPTLQVCDDPDVPVPPSSLATSTIRRLQSTRTVAPIIAESVAVPSSRPTPDRISSRVVPTPTASGTHAICGGGRANYQGCAPGFFCMKDPFSSGCGPACDGPGICVEDKMCGGFPGFPCQQAGQICVDDPRDDCDPRYGGSDCGGLCVFQH